VGSGSKFSLKCSRFPRRAAASYGSVTNKCSPRRPARRVRLPLSFGAERRHGIDELSIDVDLSDAGQPCKAPCERLPRDRGGRAARDARCTPRESDRARFHDFAVSFGRAAPGATVATAEQGFVAVRVRAELPADLAPPASSRRDRVIIVDGSQSQRQNLSPPSGSWRSVSAQPWKAGERFALRSADSACDTLPKAGLAPAAGQVLVDAQALLKARKAGRRSDLAGALRAAGRAGGARSGRASRVHRRRRAQRG